MQVKKLLSYVGVPYVVETVNSPINREIKVISVFGRNSISVDNLTQSGPIVESLWRLALKNVTHYKLHVTRILLLGVGGGSVIKVARGYYPNAEITGVEIDKKMIDLGKEYFGLDRYHAKIILEDAFNFAKKEQKNYDLICIDLLIGRRVPKKLSSEEFFKDIKRLLNNYGEVIINQLRLKKQEKNTDFLKVLREVFDKVEIKKPLINALIYCRK